MHVSFASSPRFSLPHPRPLVLLLCFSSSPSLCPLLGLFSPWFSSRLVPAVLILLFLSSSSSPPHCLLLVLILVSRSLPVVLSSPSLSSASRPLLHVESARLFVVAHLLLVTLGQPLGDRGRFCSSASPPLGVVLGRRVLLRVKVGGIQEKSERRVWSRGWRPEVQ